ncbi:uncharacterized protein LOC111042025 [Myzus persicae]|uniref:uncharacterized protein LOC111042025 n=1 Tax=Myzus persicae TaxID=13164 RepID=UPI000B935F8C|nr:uncharacterized protein LOC111042025 [Myzus persicae]
MSPPPPHGTALNVDILNVQNDNDTVEIEHITPQHIEDILGNINSEIRYEYDDLSASIVVVDANDVDNYDNFVNNIRQQSQHQNYLVENNNVIDDPITIRPSTSGHITYPNSSNDSSNVPLQTKVLKIKNLPILPKNKKKRTCTVRNIHTDPIKKSKKAKENKKTTKWFSGRDNQFTNSVPPFIGSEIMNYLN